MPLCLRFTMHKMGKSQHVTYFTCYMRLNEIMNVQCLAYYLGHSKGSVNVSPCHNDLHHSHCGCRDHHQSSASPPLSSHQQQHCHYCCCHCCPLHREHHPCPLHSHSAPPPSSPPPLSSSQSLSTTTVITCLYGSCHWLLLGAPRTLGARHNDLDIPFLCSTIWKKWRTSNRLKILHELRMLISLCVS